MDALDLRPEGAVEAAHAIRGACETLPDPDLSIEFGAFFDPFAEGRVVLLGEASHGTSEQVVDHAADWFLTHLDTAASER